MALELQGVTDAVIDRVPRFLARATHVKELVRNPHLRHKAWVQKTGDDPPR